MNQWTNLTPLVVLALSSLSVFGAVLQGSLFGLVSKLPPRFSSLFMSGQAVAGIFSGLAMLLSNICKYLQTPYKLNDKNHILLNKRIMYIQLVAIEK